MKALPRVALAAAKRCRLVRVLMLAVVFAAATSQAPLRAQPAPRPLQTLSVIAFDGGWNLPIWAAQRQGFFEANGLAVQLAYTPNSAALVTGLFDGKYQIAMASIDNVVAYDEGQGEAKVPDNPDLFAFLGGDSGLLSVVGGKDVKTIGDLKGKTVSVDAMTNGLAFVLRELVVRGGVKESDVQYVRAGGTANRYRELVGGKHDATLLRTPFEILASERGLKVLATADALGAYQGTVGVARKAWARDNEAAIVGYIRAYRAALDWLYDRANRDVVEALLVAHIRDMTPTLAKRSYDILLADKGGLARDAALDMAGIQTVLELRTKYGRPQKTLTDPARYIDNSYHRKAAGG